MFSRMNYLYKFYIFKYMLGFTILKYWNHCNFLILIQNNFNHHNNIVINIQAFSIAEIQFNMAMKSLMALLNEDITIWYFNTLPSFQ
jgi:hypothetical protein